MIRFALALAFTLSLGAFQPAEAATPETAVVQYDGGVEDYTIGMSMPDSPLKKCSFNSDCSHGKCKSGKCGACGFNSDCKGWGKCAKGQCGACSFDSECKGFGKCSSGKCTKSPYK